MRYFICTSANRPWILGGVTYVFEPIGLRGGSWLGVLAVDEPAASTILAAGLPPQISEITQERYDSEKKKVAAEQARSMPSAPPPPTGNPLLGVVAARAGAPTDRRSAEPAPAASAALASETLETTDQTPPAEPLLEEQARPKKRAPKPLA